MPFVVKVDQSIRIEDPGDTFLAFSDDISYTIKIPFRVKKKGLQVLQSRGKPKKRAKLLLFAACVCLLLENHLDKLQEIIVDNEYDGHQAEVKLFLLEYIKRKKPNFDLGKIVVQSIGKKSLAHQLALATRRGKKKVNKTISEKRLFSII